MAITMGLHGSCPEFDWASLVEAQSSLRTLSFGRGAPTGRAARISSIAQDRTSAPILPRKPVGGSRNTADSAPVQTAEASLRRALIPACANRDRGPQKHREAPAQSFPDRSHR